MTTEREKSLSDSTLLNNSSIQYGYGSLGFHTPPLPGADHNTAHIDSPASLNDDFVLHPHGSSPHFNEYASFPHFTFPHRHKKREQPLTATSPYNIVTPQQSAVSTSTYSESPLSHTDYLKYNKYLNTNQLYQYQHPYFNNINNPIYNEIFDTIPTPNNMNYLYSNTLNKMSSIDDANLAGNTANNNENINNNSLFMSSDNNNSNKNINKNSGFQLKKKTIRKCPHLLPIIHIINAAVGLAFLSQPYAIAHGGWASIIGFVIVVLISYHCCGIYIECLRRHTEYFTYPSYPQLGWIISGSWTYYSILIFSVCECVGIASVYIIFLWNNIYYLLCRFQLYGLNGFDIYSKALTVTNTINDTTNHKIWSMSNISEKNEMLVVSFSIIAILPSILILKMSSMYWLSYTILIGIIIMAFTLMFFIILQIITHEPLAHYDLEHPIEQNGWSYIYTNFGNFSISIGIFLFCFTSNSYSKLPLIQQTTINLSKQPQFFKKILRKSFLLLFIMYAFIGVCGYLLYGKSCHSIILRNIMHHCKHRGIFCDLVCIFFIICTWSAIAPLCIKISNFIESNVIYEWLRNKKQRQSQVKIPNNNNNNNGFHLLMCPQNSNGLNNTNTHTQSIDSIDSINSITYSHQYQNQKQTESQIIETPVPNININPNLRLNNNSRKHTISFDSTTNKTIYISNNAKRICRMIVFMLLLLISWMFRYHITYLESIVGICFSTITCMTLPCYLYLRSFWNTLSCLNKMAHILLTAFVICATVSLLIGCIIDMISGKDAANKA